jgi:hypothetical protein
MDNQKNYANLVSRWATGGPGQEAQFTLFMNQTGQIEWKGNNVLSLLSPLSYKDTRWHHAAITYDSASGVGILYIDGVFVATATNSSSPADLENHTNLKLVIGSDQAGVVAPANNNDRQFRGAISDVRIWDVVRSANEIFNNYRYELNGNEPGLMGYWKLYQSTATGYPGTVTQFTDTTSPQDNSIGLLFNNVWAYRPVLTNVISYSNSLNTCIWNQPVSSASSSGRWIAGGLTTSGGSSGASLFISTDVYGVNFTPIEGTGAILSEVYSLAFNGRVWIAAGVPNPNVAAQSQCCMMRTFDISGVSNWVSILGTKTNGTSPNNGDGGFDTSARSITWNSQQNMWIATGENSGIPDASSSILYSLDISGSPGSWRSVRDSNSLFSIQGNGVAFTGKKWLAAGEGVNTIISTSGTNASIANSWSGVPSASNLLSTSATDIAYTGTSIVATGQGSVYTGIMSTDASGTSWVGKNLGFETTPQLSSGTSVFYEPSNGGGVLVATGKSTTNSISYSTDYGASWTGSTNSNQLFTNGGNSVEYIGNDTLFVGGGNNVYWNGKRWISVGNIIDRSNEVVSGKLELDAMSGSTIAISDDGIMWSDVPSEFTEGRFVVSNPRIGAAPLIDSQIVISDGCDTELTSDNGSNSYSSLVASSANATSNGMGLGIAQIDIISENPIIPSAASAISNGNQVEILGVGINANGTGVAQTPGFDNTAFSITVRPLP